MTISETMAAIGEHLSAYHEKTGTSIGFRLYLSEDVDIYSVAIASTAQTYEFKDPSVLIAWLIDINQDIDPQGSAMLRQRAEQLAEQIILRDADAAALAKEIADLPETQKILDAEVAAALILQAANEKLATITAAKDVLAAEAAVAADAVAAELAKADQALLDEIAKIEAAKAVIQP